jgi:hypothetical protein
MLCITAPQAAAFTNRYQRFDIHQDLENALLVNSKEPSNLLKEINIRLLKRQNLAQRKIKWDICNRGD